MIMQICTIPLSISEASNANLLRGEDMLGAIWIGFVVVCLGEIQLLNANLGGWIKLDHLSFTIGSRCFRLFAVACAPRP
jgi:hypothetical protein